MESIEQGGQNIKNNYKLLILISVLLLLILVLYFTGREEEKTELTSFAMGSYITQTVYGDLGAEAVAEVNTVIMELEKQISHRVENSDINLLNREKNIENISVNSKNIIEKCIDVSRLTAGAFDITVAPLSFLWDFDNSPSSPPNDKDIKEALGFVGYENVILTENGAEIAENTLIDLGAVGKGSACDIAVEKYAEIGVNSAIIAVGGSVGVYGAHPQNDTWTVAIRDPYTDGGAMASIDIDSGFVSTSGTYERTFEHENTVYHHVLDPKTGYPSNSELISVTVICDSGIVSDALSTACLVMGYEESLDILKHYNAEAVFIDTDNKIKLTSGIADDFNLLSEEFEIYG